MKGHPELPGPARHLYNHRISGQEEKAQKKTQRPPHVFCLDTQTWTPALSTETKMVSLADVTKSALSEGQRLLGVCGHSQTCSPPTARYQLAGLCLPPPPPPLPALHLLTKSLLHITIPLGKCCFSRNNQAFVF